jgi:hypothetical protein
MTRLLVNSSIASIAAVLRNAAVFGRAAWHGGVSGVSTMADSPDLATRVDEFFRLLDERHIDYMLVGGVAMLKYVDGRNTEDLDLILSVDSLANLPELVIADRNLNFARGHFNALRVDLLFTANSMFRHVREQHATTHRFLERAVCVATVEGLLLLKFHALPDLYRRGDFQRIAVYEADIQMLQQRYRPDMKRLFAELQVHVDSPAFDELRQIAADIEARIARVERARGSSSQ